MVDKKLGGAGLRGHVAQGDCGLGRREIDERLRARHRLQRVIMDHHTCVLTAHHGTKVLPDPVVPGSLQHTRQIGGVAGRYRFDQHLPHAARRAGHNDPDPLRHMSFPLAVSRSPSVPSIAWQRAGDRLDGTNGKEQVS